MPKHIPILAAKDIAKARIADLERRIANALL